MAAEGVHLYTAVYTWRIEAQEVAPSIWKEYDGVGK
jgi:hypothetical protein